MISEKRDTAARRYKQFEKPRNQESEVDEGTPQLQSPTWDQGPPRHHLNTPR